MTEPVSEARQRLPPIETPFPQKVVNVRRRSVPLVVWSLAVLACALPLVLGFLLPAAVLSVQGLAAAAEFLNSRFWSLAFNSFLLATTTSVIAVLLAIFLCRGVTLPNVLFQVSAHALNSLLQSRDF